MSRVGLLSQEERMSASGETEVNRSTLVYKLYEAEPKGKLWVSGYAGSQGTLGTRLQDSSLLSSCGGKEGLVSTG